KPVGVDMTKIIDCRRGARIDLAVGEPQRRVIAAGIEGVDLRAVFLAADDAIELAIGKFAQLFGDGGVRSGSGDGSGRRGALGTGGGARGRLAALGLGGGGCAPTRSPSRIGRPVGGLLAWLGLRRRFGRRGLA